MKRQSSKSFATTENYLHNPWCACAACRPQRPPETDTARSFSSDQIGLADNRGSLAGGTGVTEEMIVEYVRRQIQIMTRTVRKVARKYMASAKEVAASKKGEGKPLLRGEHVPKKLYAGFDITITDVREAPENWTGIFIIEFKPVPGLPKADDGEPFSSWAVNKSNTAIIAALHGDDTDRWAGKKVRLIVVHARNPQSKKMVPSLSVQS